MKTIINVILVFLFSALLFGQEKPVKIIFDVTSGTTSVHESAVRHVKMMATAYPNSKFEIVMYSKAHTMVVENESTVLKQMKKLSSLKNVDLVVCQASLNHHEIEASQLIKGVRAVPDGILEIVQKQEQGWSYIKEAN